MSMVTLRLLPLPPAPGVDACVLWDDLTERDGFVPGPPASLPLLALSVELDTCAELACGACGWAGGHALAVFHRGSQYRALACCPNCHSAEEL